MAVVVYLVSYVGSTWGYIAWVSSFTIAIFTVFSTLIITNWQNQVKSKKDKDYLISALVVELQVLNDILIREKKERKLINKPLIFQEITEDYFTVFSQNADKLGCLPRAVADKIIHTYMEIRGLFDTIRCISKLNEKAWEWSMDLAQRNYPEFLLQIEDISNDAEKYKNIIEERTNKSIALIDETLSMIHKM